MKKILALAGMAFVSLFPVTARAQQADFGALRSSVAACSGVAGPSNGSATCPQWVALAGCIAQQASATGTSDAGPTCGGLSAQAVTALDRAEAICRADATASRRDRDALAALRGELNAAREELATCQQELATRRTSPVRPSGRNQLLRLPVCIGGDYGGNASLWCETRAGQELSGDDCRSHDRADLTKAGCQCPVGAVPMEAGRQAVDADGDRIRGYFCVAVFGGSTANPSERVEIRPEAASDPNVGERLAEMNGRLNALTRRVAAVEERAGNAERVGAATVRLTQNWCRLPAGTMPTPENCSRAHLLEGLNLQAPAAAAQSPRTSHSIWLNYASVLRTNGAISHLGGFGYGVYLPLGERLRLPILVGGIAGESGMNGIGPVFGFTVGTGIVYNLGTVELGALAEFTQLFDFGAQDVRLEPMGNYRGFFAGLGPRASFSLGSGITVDLNAAFGAAEALGLDPRSNQFVSEVTFAAMLSAGVSWRTP